MMNYDMHVLRNAQGGWDVRGQGELKPLRTFPTQAQAVFAAREMLRRLGGGEVITHGHYGTLWDKVTATETRTLTPRAAI